MTGDEFLTSTASDADVDVGMNLRPALDPAVSLAEYAASTADAPEPVSRTFRAASERAFTGEIELSLGTGVVVYFDAGQPYFAERVGDAPVGRRLVSLGVVTDEQLQRGMVRVGDVEHLGRMFDRDDTIDRDAVVAAADLMTDELLSEIAESTATVIFTPYRHHRSGVHRWFVGPERAALPRPIDVVGQLDQSVFEQLPEVGGRSGGEASVSMPPPFEFGGPSGDEPAEARRIDVDAELRRFDADRTDWSARHDAADAPTWPDGTAPSTEVVAELQRIDAAAGDDVAADESAEDESGEFQIVWPDGSAEIRIDEADRIDASDDEAFVAGEGADTAAAGGDAATAAAGGDADTAAAGGDAVTVVAGDDTGPVVVDDDTGSVVVDGAAASQPVADVDAGTTGSDIAGAVAAHLVATPPATTSPAFPATVPTPSDAADVTDVSDAVSDTVPGPSPVGPDAGSEVAADVAVAVERALAAIERASARPASRARLRVGGVDLPDFTIPKLLEAPTSSDAPRGGRGAGEPSSTDVRPTDATSADTPGPSAPAGAFAPPTPDMRAELVYERMAAQFAANAPDVAAKVDIAPPPGPASAVPAGEQADDEERRGALKRLIGSLRRK